MITGYFDFDTGFLTIRHNLFRQDGDISKRAPVQTEDEVGVLAQEFNSMASRLVSSFKEYQRARTKQVMI
jgi:nitrate/nitrite-specific signal transduction histidine kinase